MDGEFPKIYDTKGPTYGHVLRITSNKNDIDIILPTYVLPTWRIFAFTT